MAVPFAPDPGPGLRGDGGALLLWAERTVRGNGRSAGHGGLRFVFYGRTSTEDWQDPVTSRARQRDQAEALVRGDGVIVTEMFDVGESRTVAWGRRPRAAALVAALADPGRGWDAVVIGEYERAFYGSQYAAMAPLFEHYGVQLWMPETGGLVDYASEHGEKTMTVLGLSSKREITRTSIRVRTAMAVQAREQGRYLGGRPPYGYRLADAGPHPNKAHAAWGRRAHRLEDKLLPHLPALHLLLTSPAVRARRRTRAGADVRSTVSPGEVIGYLREHEITLTWNPAAAALQARATQTARVADWADPLRTCPATCRCRPGVVLAACLPGEDIRDCVMFPASSPGMTLVTGRTRSPARPRRAAACSAAGAAASSRCGSASGTSPGLAAPGRWRTRWRR